MLVTDTWNRFSNRKSCYSIKISYKMQLQNFDKSIYLIFVTFRNISLSSVDSILDYTLSPMDNKNIYCILLLSSVDSIYDTGNIDSSSEDGICDTSNIQLFFIFCRLQFVLVSRNTLLSLVDSTVFDTKSTLLSSVDSTINASSALLVLLVLVANCYTATLNCYLQGINS